MEAHETYEVLCDVQVPTIEEIEVEELVATEETVMIEAMVPVDYYEEHNDPHCECRPVSHEHVLKETDRDGKKHHHEEVRDNL